jgi:hypothetical protein
MPPPITPDPKLCALADSGTVNPHPKAVRDPVFVGNDFFDPRDLVQVKYEMLRRVRVEHAGLTGLLPGKRGPRGAHKITTEVLHFIERVQAEEEGVDAQVLAERIAQHFGHSVHRRTVERALARGGKKR